MDVEYVGIMQERGMAMKLTQKDIANMLGVDRSTISRALQDSPSVAPEVREKIKKFCQDLGYMPDYFASRLSGGGTKLISVIKPGHYTVSELHSRWLCGVTMAANALGHRARPDESADCGKVMAERSADGLIIVGGIEEHFPRLMGIWGSGNFPMVLTDCPPNPNTMNKVVMDNKKAIEEAVDHLASLGHSRITFFGYQPTSALSRERLHGYMKGMATNGFPIHPNFVIENERWLPEADEAFQYSEQLQGCIRDAGSSAIICVSDLAAAGVIKIIKRMGLSVPEDISVVGFDDSLLSRAWDPQITTIRQDVEEAARVAVGMLLEQIGTGLPQEDRLIATEFKARGTTGPLKIRER